MIKNVFSPVELPCECVGCFLLVPSDLRCTPSNLPPMPSAKEAALHGPLHHWGSSALWLLFGSCQSGGNWQKERMVRIHILPSLSLPPTFSALAVTFYQRSWLLMSNPRSSCHILPGFQGPPPPQPSILLLILGCFTTPSGISTSPHLLALLQITHSWDSHRWPFQGCHLFPAMTPGPALGINDFFSLRINTSSSPLSYKGE